MMVPLNSARFMQDGVIDHFAPQTVMQLIISKCILLFISCWRTRAKRETTTVHHFQTGYYADLWPRQEGEMASGYLKLKSGMVLEGTENLF
ncbi:hypothetical protein Zmor_013502 [Zophobas morio]|uniref:Uncharacterized protein n=1 Tax=Zophobas morio TaxID=2755281 RepID=A0AA38MFL7_9CUCU|nr:hypothetical protein Zmor_013502 [Zophobas morio]